MTAQQSHNFAARNKKVTIMNTKYTIKNFRVFDEKGVTVDIKPITILTGCNNSGKSSIVKSMVLLDTYIRSLINDYKSFNRIKFREHKLDFTQESTQSLGNFKQVLNRDSENDIISFEYTVHSILLGEDVRVTMSFLTEEKDILNEGYIKELRICKLNGDIIYLSSKDIPCESDGNLMVENFYRFVRGQYLVDQYRKYESKYGDIYQDLTEEEYKSSLKALAHEASEQWMNQQEKNVNELRLSKEKIDKLESDFVGVYGKEALIDVVKWSNRYGYDYGDVLGINDQEGKKTIVDKIGNFEVVDKSYNRKTFFWCPLLDEIGNLSSKEFKDGLLRAMAGYKLRKEVSLALDRIVSDFESSNCSTFEEYYKMKERDFLKKKLPAKDRYMNPPFLIGDFTRYRFDDAPIYGYLNNIHLYLDEISSVAGAVDFARLYDFIMNLNAIWKNSDHSTFYKVKDNWDDIGPYKEFEHCLYSMFNEYWTAVLRESIISLPNSMAYVPTSLVNVKRLYALDSKDDFTYLLKQYLEEKRKYSGGSSWEKTPFSPGMFINKWIKEFKIGDSISIDADPEGLGVYLRLHSSPEDKKGSLLAEQGYGITQLFVILLRIEIAIMKSKREVVNKDPYDMGCPSHYWKNDSDLTKVELSESTIAIEEPEVHLHPNFQSMLADMFFDAYFNYNVHFIIETHSEYLIRKLQTLIAKEEVSNSDVSIIYVYDKVNRPDTEPQVKRINVSNKGMLLGRFGEGFFDEADELSLNLLMQQRKHE